VQQRRGMDFSKVWKAISQEYSGLASRFSELMYERGIPIYVVSNFGIENEVDMSNIFSDKPMTIFLSIDTACRAISAMTGYAERKRIADL
jgi:hypothetical protein